MDKNNAWQLQVTNVLKSNIILTSLTSLLFLQQISFSSRDTLTLNRFMTFICSSAIKRCHRVPRESAAGEAILNSGILRQTRLCLYLRLRTNIFLCESVNSIEYLSIWIYLSEVLDTEKRRTTDDLSLFLTWQCFVSVAFTFTL